MHLIAAAGLPRLCLALPRARPKPCPGALPTQGRTQLHQGWLVRLSQGLHGALMHPKNPRIDPRLLSST